MDSVDKIMFDAFAGPIINNPIVSLLVVVVILLVVLIAKKERK